MSEVKLLVPQDATPMHFRAEGAPVMVQVGWLGLSGTVYATNDAPTVSDGREPASYSPIYVQIGTWTKAKDKWVIEYD